MERVPYKKNIFRFGDIPAIRAMFSCPVMDAWAGEVLNDFLLIGDSASFGFFINHMDIWTNWDFMGTGYDCMI